MITLVNTAFIAGALALFVPYLVHLMTRRTPRRIVFPTLQFLQKAHANQSRLFRLRHIILMLVRTAFILLLLIAFLRPIHFENRPPAGADAASGTAHIVLVDASASMRFQEGGFSRFARAQRLAEEILDRLGPDDPANLILADRTPVTSFPEPAANRFHLKRDLQAAEPTFERAEIDAALAEATRQFNALEAGTKKLHVISDFQRTNWAAADFSELPKDVEPTFIGVGDDPAGNVAVTSLSIRPARPALGEPVELTAEIANYSDRSNSVEVQLAFDDRKPLTRTVTLRPNAVGSASFRFRANTAGSFEATVSIPNDGLAADDRRYAAMTVSDRVRVMIVSDADPANDESSVRYLARALSPSEGGAGTPDVRVVRASEAADALDPETSIIVLDGAANLPMSVAECIHDRVSEGGALVHFLSGPNEMALQGALAEAAGGEWPAPVTLGPRMRRRNGESSRLAQANFDDPLLRKFREADDLREVSFYSYHQTERVEGVGQILLRYQDGNVAMARASHGQGQILLCNFSAGLDDSDLAKRTIFVPLVQEIMKSCRTVAARTEFLVGQAASLVAVRPAIDGDLRFTGPGGAELSASVDQREQEAAVLFADTHAPGFYRAWQTAERLASAAVNVDPRESDLSALTADQVTQLAAGTQATVLTGEEASVGTLERLFEGRPLWHYFAAAALAMLIVEMALQTWWRR